MFLFLLAYSYKVSIVSSLSCQYFMTYLYCNDQCEGTHYKQAYVWIVYTYSSDWNKCVNTSSLAKYDEDLEYLRVCPAPIPDPTPSLTLQATPEVTPWETPNKTPLYTLEMTPQITPNMTQILVVSYYYHNRTSPAILHTLPCCSYNHDLASPSNYHYPSL